MITYLDDPNIKPSTDIPFNECEDFSCMFRSTLEGQRILYCAEMDGIESDEAHDLSTYDLNKCNFVELKLKLRESSENQMSNYRRKKLLHWWSQCFLVKIRKIIVGIRDGNGILNEISHINVEDIPKQAQVSQLFN